MGSLGNSISMQSIAVEPCNFPALSDGGIHSLQGEFEIDVKIVDPISKILSFCNNNGIELSDWVKTAWAIVLSSFTGTSVVTFGTSHGSPGGSNNARRSVFSLDVKPETTVHRLLQLVHRSSQQYSARKCTECFEIDCALISAADHDFNTEIMFDQCSGNDVKSKVRANIAVLLKHLTHSSVF